MRVFEDFTILSCGRVTTTKEKASIRLGIFKNTDDSVRLIQLSGVMSVLGIHHGRFKKVLQALELVLTKNEV